MGFCCIFKTGAEEVRWGVLTGGLHRKNQSHATHIMAVKPASCYVEHVDS